MSIITDALKKAERDRGQKLGEKAGEIPVASLKETMKPSQVLEEEEKLLEENLTKMTSRAGTPFFAWPHFSWREANVFVVRGTLVIGFAVLVVFLFLTFRWEASDHMVASVSLPTVQVPSGGKTVSAATKTFFPKRQAAQPTLSYTLTGISTFDDKHYAIINGLVLQTGDSVDGAVVKDITDREAILETRAGELRLRIPL